MSTNKHDQPTTVNAGGKSATRFKKVTQVNKHITIRDDDLEDFSEPEFSRDNSLVPSPISKKTTIILSKDKGSLSSDSFDRGDSSVSRNNTIKSRIMKIPMLKGPT